MLIYQLEADVAIRRPPSRENIRTTFIRLAVEERSSLTRTDNEAKLLAAWIAERHGVMVTAVRILGVEL